MTVRELIELLKDADMTAEVIYDAPSMFRPAEVSIDKASYSVKSGWYPRRDYHPHDGQEAGLCPVVIFS